MVKEEERKIKEGGIKQEETGVEIREKRGREKRRGVRRWKERKEREREEKIQN